MARIISSRKKYVPVKDLVVYPSKTETIEVIPDDGFNGAHRYRARMCAGFVNGKTKYVDATDTIQFVHKHEDGTITPGWQSEQLALILLDRVKKLNEKFPCEQNAQGKPYMCTSDIATWIGVDNKWYYVYRPGVSTSIIPLLELTKDEDEMFDYLKDISEFGHENPHN